MKIFLDTSVLVAAFTVQHIHHRPSFAVYRDANLSSACCAAHSLAEVYATLTRIPGSQRMNGEQVLVLLDNIREHLGTVALTEIEYYSTIADAAGMEIIGGSIYDALIARCALKANAATIYTWNVEQFRRCGPEVAKRVRTP